MTTRWDDIDYPVLNAIYDLEEAKRRGTDRDRDIDHAEIADRTGLDRVDVLSAVLYLHKAGQIEGVDVGTLAGPGLIVLGVTPKGLQSLNQWPSGERLSEILPELLKTLAEHTQDPEGKTILGRAGDVLQSVAAATIAAAVGEVTGLR